MLEGWEDFYLLIGSAGAALIGLLFVVVTLTTGRDRRSVMWGQRLYLSPIVFQLSLILLLSGAAMAPGLGRTGFALLCGVVALVAAIVGTRIAIGIYCAPTGRPGWDDICWYGLVPALLFFLLAGAAAALAADAAWGSLAIAAVLMGILLVSIHNAWDLVTYLAPGANANADAAAPAGGKAPPSIKHAAATETSPANDGESG